MGSKSTDDGTTGGSNNSPSSKSSSSLLPSLFSTPLKERLARTPPGMNISFVLDGIMGNDDGLRPLDIESFRTNNEKQKLRVVSSCVDPVTGTMHSKCFGTDDFFHDDYAMVEHYSDSDDTTTT